MSVIITLVSNPDSCPLSEDVVDGALAYLKKHGHASASASELSKHEAYDILLNEGAIPIIDDLIADWVSDRPIDFMVGPAEKRRKQLLISDMDSTIIQQECIDEIADQLGLKQDISAITERAMNGEIAFPEALEERVGLLEGLDASKLEDVYTNHITLSEGAKTLVNTMKNHGSHCMLVSGGFTFFTSRVAQAAGFHEDQANTLEIVNDKLSGKVGYPILDKEAKLDALMAKVKDMNITVDDSIAIGDGANDLPMLCASGLGVAYYAKPVVQEQVTAKINHTSLETALFFQGYKRQEFSDD